MAKKAQDDPVEPVSNQGTRALSERLAQVRRRLRAAEARAGRPAGSVELLAVIKLVPDDEVRSAIELGLTELGENRVQNLLARPPEVASRARLHLIGSLQTNKAKKAVAACAEFHALDRVDLVPLLEREAAALAKTLPVWIQVNVAREPQKHGCAPEECERLVAEVRSASHLELRGLMTMAPLAEDTEAARPHFRALADLSRELHGSGVLPSAARGLSMGMSSDFETAVEEGATVVRVGSALFRDENA